MSVRLLLAGVALALAGPAVAQSCIQGSERTAFEVRALQSQLMVAALTCQRDGDYNAFVRKFQGELGGAYNTIRTHFRRTAGGGHQRALDGFITHLANEHSQDGIRQGSRFCQNIGPLFQAALAQSNASALADMSIERNVLNPFAAPACADRAPASAPNRRRPAARTRTAAAR
ncbi:hypothetical protein [Falsiroseomonas selenitidurans]|uniref:Uncharacterized protein n=1 Tax=Falsiroseomonas selenitidurans TaxID=2716335 RepID=A0ABX1EBI5_9PROT|nr:hypothetical protein [Falsiroseomonas selenitidurans]NKC34168.1 hypothetical protein [Falsiroseomonas selenitidurans]